MRTIYATNEIFANHDVIRYCEDHGIYEVYSLRGNIITYYSLYSEGMYKVQRNINTGKESRKLLRYKNIRRLPRMFYGANGGCKYNYMEG